MGPVVSKLHFDKIRSYIDFAKKNSLQVIEVGVFDEKMWDKGYFIRPTVVLNVDDQSKLMTEEIFGPVICMVPFEREDEVKYSCYVFIKKYNDCSCRLLNEQTRTNTAYVLHYGPKMLVELIE